MVFFDCNTMHGSNGNITPSARSNLFYVYNHVDNAVQAPFCEQKPRPAFVAERENFAAGHSAATVSLRRWGASDDGPLPGFWLIATGPEIHSSSLIDRCASCAPGPSTACQIRTL